MPSSPAIPHDYEDQQSEGTNEAATSDRKEKDSEDEGSTDENEADDEEEDEVQKTEVEGIKQNEEMKTIKERTPMTLVKKMYFARDLVDDLSDNVVGPSQIVQYTVLPENNVNCFFQNRAQYWRLSSGERQEYSLEKCPCCDFTYPSTQQPLNQGPMAASKIYNPNAVTDSLLTFLKSTEQSSPVMSNNAGKRLFNNNNNGNSSFGYQTQQPIQPTPHQYQAPNSGFYNNNNNSSNNNNSYNYNQQMNPFMNNGSGYGTTLALLNLMNNASRNAASAFQAMNNTNNTPRYYNNNGNNSMSNGYGLYKQF